MVPHLLYVAPFAAFVWSCHTTPSIPLLRESEHCVTRPNTGWKREKIQILQQRENQNYSSIVSYLKNIISRNINYYIKQTETLLKL